MLSGEDIRQALRARRVMPLGVSNPHSPPGLEQLAAAVTRFTSSDREDLSIPLRDTTRQKLKQLARAEHEATACPITAAELAAAVVEQFVASMPNS